MISEYTNLSFNELIELDCVTYRKLLRDSIVFKLEQTEEGRDYLNKCWALQQVKPDYSRLKEKYT